MCLLGFLRQEFRIKGEATVGHAVHVEQFVMHGEQFAKIGLATLEAKSPHLDSVSETELLRTDFRQRCEEIAAAEQFRKD